MSERLRVHAPAWLAAVALGATLAACSTGTVVLLPEDSGAPTAVNVRQGDKEVVLDRPYAAANQTALGPRAYQSSPEAVDARFGPALAAAPARPATFTLYFELGTETLTAESQRLVDQVLAEIARRPVPDVVVIGHTDAVGNDASNDALGQRRADSVRDGLIRMGVKPEDIRALSRGKRELAVPTPDNVAEPRNRRVVIEVR
jgi:outer membrane protein OmpA-like peptidoglycan-associated protein